ncbi:ABC transporter substrate-binding protein [Halobacteriales archaeon QS_4_62_28]|nr:MAG: ABC transporter substrate-binding protein [Halobacteriales archaeon QS_4_62_28]
MGRLRTIAGWESASQISLEIKTLPADADPYAIRIARQLALWLTEAGIDTTVTPMDGEELLRQVLLRNEYDLFVTRIPDRFRSPETLYSLLHSRYSESPGWQNPFGYTNLDVDDQLESQRRVTGDTRWRAVSRLQQTVARTQPFTVIAFPDDIRAARTNNYANWREVDMRSPFGYLRLSNDTGRDRETGSTTATPGPELRVVSTDHRPTENLNPLSVEFRRDGLVTGLLYDSLGFERTSESIEPWLAASWSFETSVEGIYATVRLRDDLTWHDGTAITADDVAFTYPFLADTSMGSIDTPGSDEDRDSPVPAPRFQGPVSLVETVRATGPRTVEFDFVDCTRRIARRAFTVPVLPKHVWRERTGSASVGGIEVGSATEALVTTNIPPVGSGALKFEEHTAGDKLVLEQYEDHFLSAATEESLPAGFAGKPTYERLSVNVAGSDTTAVEMVRRDEADVTGTAVGAETVPRIGRASDLELLVRRSESPFLVGYNTRRPPLTNPRFRNTIARLIDQSHLTQEAFEGYAAPAVSPLAATRWLPEDLEWTGESPVAPFLGTDGELDIDRVRDAFRDAGYQYNDDKLVETN